MMITGMQRIDLARLYTLRKRVELEIKLKAPQPITMRACQQHGFKGKTRKKALTFINTIIERKEDELAKM